MGSSELERPASDAVSTLGQGGVPGPVHGDATTLQAVTAGLRRDGADLALYGGFLISTLTEALPEGLVTVERRRTAGDRMRGREGQVVGVSVSLGDKVFRLVRDGVGARPQASVGHASGGVTMSTTTVPLDAWADQLAAALVTAGEQDAAAADAAARIAVPGGADL